jgi:4-hydroxybenzoate polyprenyltransferase
VAEPVPDVIQAAVKHCLLSLVFLDAAICYLVWDFPAALVVIFVFLIPAFLLGRWIYST